MDKVKANILVGQLMDKEQIPSSYTANVKIHRMQLPDQYKVTLETGIRNMGAESLLDAVQLFRTISDKVYVEADHYHISVHAE